MRAAPYLYHAQAHEQQPISLFVCVAAQFRSTTLILPALRSYVIFPNPTTYPAVISSKFSARIACMDGISLLRSHARMIFILNLKFHYFHFVMVMLNATSGLAMCVVCRVCGCLVSVYSYYTLGVLDEDGRMWAFSACGIWWFRGRMWRILSAIHSSPIKMQKIKSHHHGLAARTSRTHHAMIHIGMGNERTE